MKIGVLSMYKEKEITGINKVTMGLMEELLKLDRENDYVFLGKTDWLPLDMEHIPGCRRLRFAQLCHVSASA